ncbi:MAG: GT4 family glycosyltransferase PelF [Sulfuricellaceae bacterium]|jgi:glycosyltransferase involved in cell wall biosynthesis
MNFTRGTHADIGLLLEGTYPYVSGGVSSWVHQLIRGFPEYTFALIFIGSRPEDYGDRKYPLPDNVVHLEHHYIFSSHEAPPVQACDGDAEVFERVDKLHEAFRTPLATPWSGLFAELAKELHEGGKLPHGTFLYGRRSWDFIRNRYSKYCADPSYIDYFWTVRIMHTPVWLLAAAGQHPFPVRAYHTVSTGYAGFLGALLKQYTGKPLILSEHGIYTKERKIDLFQSDWVRDNRNLFQRSATEIGYLKQLWIRFFEVLGKMCYDACDHIVALYEANRQRQLQDGAPEGKTRCIPNGVNLSKLVPLRRQRAEGVPPVMCLIGRVVPIKDVKTYIRAMRTVVNRVPEAQGWIVGPEEEDPEYARECRELVQSLGLAESVKFLGFQKVEDILPKVGLLVLSSISEALPLVVLEAYGAGVPVVTTDVGSCRQLVYGLAGEDEALGPSGRIVGIASPEALADACLELLTDEEAWHAAQKAGMERVERYYSEELVFDSYRGIYRACLKET